MVRNTAREIAVHLAYELSFTDKTAEELVAERLSRDGFAELAGEDELYSEAMYEILYFRDVPNSVAINEAVEIAKKYETPETVKFINGILGSFVRAEISAE